MAGVQSNPLFDDASLRLTPREDFAAAAIERPPAHHAAAVEAAVQLPHNSAGVVLRQSAGTCDLCLRDMPYHTPH